MYLRKQRVTKIQTLLSILSILLPLAASANTDKYRLAWREDPSSSMVIGWNQIDGENPQVHFGTEDHGDEAKKYAETHGVDASRDYRALNNRFARLTGLKADTAYYFVIKDSNSVSERMWFKTAPDTPQPFSFIAGGDTRTNGDPRRRGNQLVAKLRPLFVAHGGDYMGIGSDKEWVIWFDDWQLTKSEDGRMYPVIAAHGNHENRDAQMIHKLFDTPNPDMYFALNIAGNLLRLYTLNTEILGKDEKRRKQKDWLKTDLEEHGASAKWLITSYHRPMRAHTAGKAEGIKQIEDWAQLFYDHGMDLVIECDTHMTKRTFPLRPDDGAQSFESFIRDDAKGTIFIGEGSWGAPKRPDNDDKPWTMASDSFWQFKWIHVHEEKIEVRSVRFETDDDVTNVVSVSDDDPLKVPENLHLWQPDCGAVLTLPFDAKNLPTDYVQPMKVPTPDPEVPVPEGEQVKLIQKGAEWKYYNNGGAPESGWQGREFDDASWDSGRAKLGYGDGNARTNLKKGPSKSKKNLAVYFRREFIVSAPDTLNGLIFDLLCDDGAVVYVNGEEVGRENMPQGKVKPATKALKAIGAAAENTFHRKAVDTKNLVPGVNVVAVEVHQQRRQSSDMGFDFQLSGILKKSE